MRWLKFNAVGGIGIGVQLVVLAALTIGLHVGYRAAVAVESAVIHNFLSGMNSTWADRPAGSFSRFLRFNRTTGVVSIAGNVALMKFFVDEASLPYLAANGITTVACSLANFLVSERFVFRQLACNRQ